MRPSIGQATGDREAIVRALLCASVIVAGAPVLAPSMLLSEARAQATPASGIEVRGNQRIERDTIVAYTGLEPGRPITVEDLNAAVRALFETGLFADVAVTPRDGRIVIEVRENPSINQIAFEGNSALPDEALEDVVDLRARLPFTPSRAEAAASRIVEVYRRTGRYGASVEPVVIERPENRVDLVFEIEEGDLTGVSSIDFVGNEAFSDRRLRGVVETRESGLLSFLVSSDIYDPDRLELDRELLRQFYLDEGYADFQVLSATAELAPDASGFFITFTVEEGPVYDFGTFDVDVDAEGLDPEAFRALIPEDLEGETYDASEVQEIANEMTDLAGQRGFAFVQVRPRAERNAAERTVDITFELAEGERIFVERIDIVGNSATLDRVIRREIDIVEGDAFDAREIRQAQARIRGLGFFRSVDIDAQEGSAPDRAVLVVEVEERSTGSLSLGLGFSTSAGPIGSVAVTERNFLGRGQRVQATLTAAGDTQVYDLSFTEPKVLDRDLAVGARAFFIDDDRTDESSFNQVRGGFTPTASFPLGEDTGLQLRYSFRFDDIDVDRRASPAIQADGGQSITSLVGYTLSYDRRNDPIEPTSGYLLTFDQDIAGLGGDAQFLKTRAAAKGWQAFFDDDVVVSLELESGAIFSYGDSDTRITERFFLGSDSFRGFAVDGIGPRDIAFDDALGGNYFAVSRLQVSFPIGLPEELGVFAGAFVDAGTLFGLDRTTFGDTTIDDSAALRVSAGGLIFVNSPFGPIEVSLGVPLIEEDFDEEELFRFAVGTRF